MDKPPVRQGSFCLEYSSKMYCTQNLERSVSVADIEELEILYASEIHARRLNAEEVITPQSSESLLFTIAE